MISGQRITSVRDIPRVGEKVAGRLLEHFGSEEAALDAILSGDLTLLSEVNGISQKFALSLFRDAAALAEGVSISDFLKTKEAFELYSRLLELIQSCAHTPYAREKLNLFYPYPGSRKDLIEKRRAFVMQYAEIARTFFRNQEFLSLFSRVRPLSRVSGTLRVRDRVVLCSDPEIFELACLRFQAYLPVQAVDSIQEFVDLAGGYSQVIVFEDEYLGFDLPEGLEPEYFPDPKKAELWQIVPEYEIAYFAKNRECISSCLSVVSKLRAEDFSFFEELPQENLEKLSALLRQLGPDGKLANGLDPELDRLGSSLSNLDTAVSAALLEANQRLSRALEKSSLTLNGQEVLQLIDGGLEVKALLAKEIHKTYSLEVEAARQEISEKLVLSKAEKLDLDTLFPEEISYPLAADPKALQLFRQKLTRALEKARLSHKRELAKQLFTYHPLVEKLVREVLDFDVGFSIGCFSEKFGLHMPKMCSEPVLGFKEGENLFLKARFGKVSPVSYSIGKTAYSPAGSESRVVLLSGVNSGGKTSLLELVAQCTVLGNMGFLVPAAELELGPVDELYYFGKSKGTLDAGAFETTLKQFSVVSCASSKLVLADELESITEPGASARIIAGILEFLSKDKTSMGVFVSHLSELILKNTEADVRVDGIEAKGLDSKLELIVDRNPVYNHVAKSTPELIVERLLRKTSGKEREFYELLRNKF